jgi:hypothetical protein
MRIISLAAQRKNLILSRPKGPSRRTPGMHATRAIWSTIALSPADRQGTLSAATIFGADMTTQLPGPAATFLDHVAHFVPAMEGAAAAMARLGFHLTPLSVQGNLGADCALVPTGTANRCAMFRRGYIEILARVSDSALARQLEEKAARYVGIHLVAFSTADTEKERARLAAAGFAPLPFVRLRRHTSRGDEARFTVLRVPPEAMPEGRVQMLTHHTEAAVWHPDDLTHPNGAVSLEAVHIVVTAPETVSERYARFAGRPAERLADATWRIAAERGRIEIHGPPGPDFAPAGQLPQITAYEIGVADLPATRAFLDRNGIKLAVDERDRIAARAPPALGGVVLFRAATL